jgi:hypothetical protein
MPVFLILNEPSLLIAFRYPQLQVASAVVCRKWFQAGNDGRNTWSLW